MYFCELEGQENAQKFMWCIVKINISTNQRTRFCRSGFVNTKNLQFETRFEMK